MRSILSFLLLCTPLFATPAMAQSACAAAQGCVCAVPLASLPNGIFGQLNPSGEVMVSGASGSVPALTPVNLAVGDSAVILESGNATLSAGPSCNLQLPARSSLVIRSVGDCACASVVAASRQAEGNNEGAGSEGSNIGGIAAASVAIGGGAAALLLLKDDDNGSASP